MSDLPDEFLLSMHEYNIETAKHDLGRSKKKPPLPHQVPNLSITPSAAELFSSLPADSFPASASLTLRWTDSDPGQAARTE